MHLAAVSDDTPIGIQFFLPPAPPGMAWSRVYFPLPKVSQHHSGMRDNRDIGILIQVATGHDIQAWQWRPGFGFFLNHSLTQFSQSAPRDYAVYWLH